MEVFYRIRGDKKCQAERKITKKVSIFAFLVDFDALLRPFDDRGGKFGMIQELSVSALDDYVIDDPVGGSGGDANNVMIPVT